MSMISQHCIFYINYFQKLMISHTYKWLIMQILESETGHHRSLYKRSINKINRIIRRLKYLSPNQQSTQRSLQALEKLDPEQKQYTKKVIETMNNCNQLSITSNKQAGILTESSENTQEQNIQEINLQSVHPLSLEQFSFIIKGRSFDNVRYANRIIGFSLQSLINQYIAKAACSLINVGGGYILLASQYFPRQKKITKGIKLNQSNLQLWEENIRIIKSRLEPQDNVNIDMSFLPLKSENGDSQQKSEYVIRLIVTPKNVAKACFYREGTAYTFFTLCSKNHRPKPVKATDLYNFILNKNKQDCSTFMLQEPITTLYEVFIEPLAQPPQEQPPTLTPQLVSQFHSYKKQIDQQTQQQASMLKIKLNKNYQSNLNQIKAHILNQNANSRFFQLPPKFKQFLKAHQDWKQNFTYFIVKSNLKPLVYQEINRKLQTMNNNQDEKEEYFYEIQTKIEFSKCMDTQNYQLLKSFAKIFDKEPYFFEGKLKNETLYSGFKIYCYNNQKPLPPSHITYIYFYTLALGQRPTIKGYNS